MTAAAGEETLFFRGRLRLLTFWLSSTPLGGNVVLGEHVGTPLGRQGASARHRQRLLLSPERGQVTMLEYK